MGDREASDARFATIFLRRQLVGEGWNDRAIARMVAEGQWAKPRRGAYVDAQSWHMLDGAGRHEVRTRAVLKQAKTELVVSHASGVPFYDGPTWGLDLSSVHVTRVDGKAGRAEAGVQQHCGVILDGDVLERHG